MHGRLLLASLAACSGSESTPALDLPSLLDTNPDPAVVEVALVAAPATAALLDGKRADVWAYRDGMRGAAGRIPGPTLEVPQGAHVIVHFTNELPVATTIHWHGLRVPNTADGTPAAQVPVEPGGRFDYVFDAGDPGTFWYHPHVESDVQVERGLYGAVVVRGGVEPDVAADRVFVLDDVKLEATGQLSSATAPLDVMLGRQGNVLLANGTNTGSIAVASGTRERWRFINAANGRYFRLAVSDHPFRVIGWDGGLVEAPYDASSLLVAPGERYEVLVEFADEPGTTVALQTLHYDRGHDLPDPGPLDVFAIQVGDRGPSPAPLPDRWATFEPIATGAETPVRSLVLDEQEEGLREPKFFINGMQYPAVPPIVSAPGATEIWQVRNDSEMDHPFHLHGMFFQPLDLDGVAPAHQGWKDTINIPRKATLRFAVRYAGAGRWMYHCHILEHAERGMMGELELR